MRVAKAGYFGGIPAMVRMAPLEDVLNILDYERYLNEYEYAEYKLNEDES